MKRFSGCLVVLLAAVSLAGCMSPDGRVSYTTTGAFAGATAGALIGSAGRHPGPDALVGAAIGAVAGGLIGNAMDMNQQERLRAQSPQTMQRIESRQPLGLDDVKALAKAGLSDEIIMSQIRNSHTVYHLNTTQIIDLKNAGVSEKVIDFMINTPNTVESAPAASVVETPPPSPVVEHVIVTPDPDYVWIGGEWIWGGRGWVWVHGHYAIPPHPHTMWVPGEWHRDHGYGRGRWVRGYWR